MNFTIAAVGKLDKGIVRTPPAEFLRKSERRRGVASAMRLTRVQPERKADPFDYGFDKCPI